MTTFHRQTSRSRLQRFGDMLRSLINVLETYFAPIVDFVARGIIGYFFIKSGLSKYEDYWGTKATFNKLDPIPYIPPSVETYMATGIEILCPVLLFLGLSVRFFAAPALLVTLIIMEAAQPSAAPWTQNPRYLMMIPLAFFIARGPGNLSIDFFLRRRRGE